MRHKFNPLKLFVLVVFIGFITKTNGQYSFSLNYLNGKMLSHSHYTQELEAPVQGFQIDVLWKLRKETDDLKKKSNGLIFVPQIGVSTAVLNMGLPTTGIQLGSGLVLGGSLTNKKDISFNWSFCHGLSVLTEKYDTFQKPINYAIGSYVNYFAQLKTGVEYRISTNVALNLGFYLTHASNGNIRKPNVGLNVLHWGIGMLYCPNELYNTEKSSFYLHKKRFRTTPYSVGAKIGIREHTLEYPETFSTFIFDFQYRIQKNAQHVWNLGFDLFNDPNYKFDKVGRSTGISEDQQFELGIFGGHQFQFGRIGLRTDLGVYVLRPVLSEKPFFYNGIGLEYRLSQDWIVRSRLKAHLNVADYMEFGFSRLF